MLYRFNLCKSPRCPMLFYRHDVSFYKVKMCRAYWLFAIETSMLPLTKLYRKR